MSITNFAQKIDHDHQYCRRYMCEEHYNKGSEHHWGTGFLIRDLIGFKGLSCSLRY